MRPKVGWSRARRPTLGSAVKEDFLLTEEQSFFRETGRDEVW